MEIFIIPLLCDLTKCFLFQGWNTFTLVEGMHLSTMRKHGNHFWPYLMRCKWPIVWIRLLCGICNPFISLYCFCTDQGFDFPLRVLLFCVPVFCFVLFCLLFITLMVSWDRRHWATLLIVYPHIASVFISLNLFTSSNNVRCCMPILYVGSCFFFFFPFFSLSSPLFFVKN